MLEHIGGDDQITGETEWRAETAEAEMASRAQGLESLLLGFDRHIALRRFASRMACEPAGQGPAPWTELQEGIEP
jgi:hypothetical protein